MADTGMTRAEAAAARALKARDQTARPVQRSAGPFPGDARLWTPAIRTLVHVERAAAGSKTPNAARFEGLASVTGKPYVMYDWAGEYEEIVAEDAGDQSLARADLDVPLVLSHDSMRRIARTGNAVSPLELSRGELDGQDGLLTVGPTLDLSDPDTAYIVPKMESGLIDEMSFRFSIEAGRWNDEFTTYTIQRYDIHRGDVSIVGYGANPMTAGAGLRSSSKDDDDLKRIQLAMLGLNRDRKAS